MSMMTKNFNFENKNVTTIVDQNSNVWFKGFDVATILGYVNTSKSIQKHVEVEDKLNRGQINNPPIAGGFKGNESNQVFINESGIYSLILRSKLESAKSFKKWITSEVLPTLRKTGQYNMNHKTSDKKTFTIETESDLHKKVVQFLRKRFPHSLFVATLGENQITSELRIKSQQLGYMKGSPDLIINNLNKKYTGFAIEFKSPSGKGILSDEQTKMMKAYDDNGFKTLISNDYDAIIEQLLEYFRDVRIKCHHCSTKFKSSQTLMTHQKHFHKMN